MTGRVMISRNRLVEFTVWMGVLLFIGGAFAGCSVLYKIDDECDANSDCTSAAGVALECRQHLCVWADETGEHDTATATDTSSGDSDTVLTGLDLLGGPCTRIDGMDDPSLPIPDDAIVIGSILPTTGELEVPGTHFDQVTLLALEEINKAGGIWGRNFIKVSCDSGTSPVTARAAAEHLRDLGIQAVLGPFASEIVLSVYSDVFKDAGMMVVSAGANAPIVAKASADGLIWSTSLPAAREATVLAEEVLHSDWQKVAVVRRGDAWGDSMFEAFYSRYCTAEGIDCNDADSFFVRAYETEDLQTSLSEVVPQLVAWQPDILVALTYVEDAIAILSFVGSNQIPVRSILWNSVISTDLTFVYINPELHGALCQVQSVVQETPAGIAYGSFLTRYRARFYGDNPVPYTANFYDAAYMLGYAYAAAASDENPSPTGKEIAAAMGRLSSGTQIAAGSEEWNTGLMALGASEKATIDFVGVSGDVDFEGGTGTIICPVEAIRFNVGDQSIESVGQIYSADDEYTAPDYSTVTDSVCGENIQP